MRKILLSSIAMLSLIACSKANSQNPKENNENITEINVIETSVAEDAIMAPNFTLKDLDGKDVSLTDFRGKWVILDFWGSWCIWCIRGIPELKDAYQKYGDQLVIVGIDCNESQEDWRAGVKKYELPWVNVYCPNEDFNILQSYGVEGFPTKAIVSPTGVLENITVGHDPEFYTILSNLIGK